jgi:hypothetical protein
MPTTAELAAILADLPPYTHDPVDRLRHTLAAYPHTDPTEGVLAATHNAYPDHPWTGLTFGDLHALLALLDERQTAEYWRGVDDGRVEVMENPGKWLGKEQ